MAITTEQEMISAVNVGCPWRGPGVMQEDLDELGEDHLGETQDHVGTWQALAYLYGGVMAVTYRAGVDATDANRVLGTLRSDAVTAGTQIYFLSLDKILGIGELANGAPTASSTNSALTLSAVTETTAAMSTNDKTVVAPIGRAIEFRVTLATAAFAKVRAPILVQWPTDGSNVNNQTIWLDIEFQKI